MRRLIDSAPLLAHEAVASGLVDAALYRDQALHVARLMAAANAARLAAAAAAAPSTPADAGEGAAVAVQPAAAVPLPRAQLLREALAALDAEPQGGPKLELVPLRRYVVALAEAKRVQEAAARRAALLAGLRQWVAGLLGHEERKEGSAEQAGQDGGEPTVSAPAPGQLPTVALLTLQGPIFLGAAQPSAVPSPSADASSSVASLPVIKQLRAAREDKRVRAVVLRIDSPGTLGLGVQHRLSLLAGGSRHQRWHTPARTFIP